MPAPKTPTALWCLFVALLSLACVPTAKAADHLRVSANGHYLTHADGRPFFYLGDTAWELFHRLNREETEYYLQKRADQGFTVIQAVALAEFDGLTEPNRDGQLPLIDNDPARPNEKYFQHIDWVVMQAEQRGLFIGLLPTWGDKWSKRWGVGPEIFTPENAHTYGEFLGKRYRDHAIIWILGGDRSPENPRHFEIIRAMADGIRSGNGGTQLMTYHPSGGQNSAKWFQQDAWLDFNMFQSGHGAVNIPNYEKTLANRALTPAKPTVDGEPRYEDHPINWHKNGETGWFDDYDARQAAYWSMLAGAAGHTFGNHDIWQFLDTAHKPVSFARTPWRTALDQPGAGQMKLMRELLEKYPWWPLVPDPLLVAGGLGVGAEHIAAARSEDSRFALLYLPQGDPVTVHLNKLATDGLHASWFDPRTGKTTTAGLPATKGNVTLTPPSNGRGNDWVLILSAATKP